MTPSSPRFALPLAAAALLLLGVGVGMGVERLRAGEDSTQFVSSEVLAPRSAGGEVTGLNQRPGVARGQQLRPSAERGTTRRRLGLRRTQALRRPLGAEEASEQALEGEDLELELEAGDALEGPLELAPVRAEWLLLVDRGDYAGAFAALDQGGGFDAVLVGGSAEELMDLAEVARFAGRQGRAIQAYRAVTNRYRSDEQAPIAALMLGNLLQSAGDAEGASAAYALNRTLSPGGDFAEDALAREFDVAVSSRDLPGVESLFDQYAQEFPSGRHLEDMRSLVEELRLELGDSSGRGSFAPLSETESGGRDWSSAVGDAARSEASGGESGAASRARPPSHERRRNPYARTAALRGESSDSAGAPESVESEKSERSDKPARSAESGGATPDDAPLE